MKVEHVEALQRFVFADPQGGGLPKVDRLLAAKVVWARHRAQIARMGQQLGPRANPETNRAMHGTVSAAKSSLTSYHRIAAIRCKRLP